MRLYFGAVILLNAFISFVWWMITLGDGDIKEMFENNIVWTICYSMAHLGIWLLIPYLSN